MERENRGREDLSPWEQGVFYAKLLDRQVFRSLRQLGDRLGVDSSTAGKAVQLASLPAEIVAAFPSPLDLQFRWAGPLQEAVSRNPEAVVKLAQELASLEARPAAKEVFDKLAGTASTFAAPQKIEFKTADGTVGAVWSKDRSGAATLKVKSKALTEAQERRLIESVRKALS